MKVEIYLKSKRERKSKLNYLFDTNFLIKLFNKTEPYNTNFKDGDIETYHICAITVGEIYYGVEKSDPAKKNQNKIARDLVMSYFKKLQTNDDVCSQYGLIKTHLFQSNNYSPNNENDIWIASFALAYDMTLVTENTKDFSNVPNIKLISGSKPF